MQDIIQSIEIISQDLQKVFCFNLRIIIDIFKGQELSNGSMCSYEDATYGLMMYLKKQL
jgi:hypothetical protein